MMMCVIILPNFLQKSYLLKQPEAGRFIQAFRQLTGLTQEQFGLRVRVSYKTVSQWENGRMQPYAT